MKKPFLALSILSVLAACGTPQEQCIRRNTEDLRTVERLIAESRGNLNRGYALERYTVTVPDWQPCIRYVPGTKEDPTPRPVSTTCRSWDTETRTRPQSIDLSLEAKKLDQLLVKQRELSRQAQSVVKQCQALYPE
ncbi:hypothetical protein [Pseudogemmobacter faecipullorum]|uniref:Type IV secretion system putative lipoprotein virB7 n=1 Tax=Pseudogemmobacter faecipullorum TaxID=2755041 RepID=A0ABS8CH74_9RHOB|nr:hypothetical protein [Pseudogemmobacter faecipullorum]MCB5408709.1 hypothetical protein [Pseudogemmobacter faecipullorum]